MLTAPYPAREAFISSAGGAPAERLRSTLAKLGGELAFFLN